MTPFTNIYEYALTVIDDYKLNKLAMNNYSAFLTQMRSYLISAIPEFTGCMKSLEYTLDGTPSFVENLTIQEQKILGDYLVLVWFRSVVQDITQLNLRLQGRDKKSNSEASNLKEKKNYLTLLEERVSQRVRNYQLMDTNFDEIFSQ